MKQLLFILFFPSLLFTQNLPTFPVTFIENGKILQNPTVGGLDLPQFSAADLNNDGIQDLYVYDRLGNVHLGFVNENLSDSIRYSFDWELTKHFPELSDWVLLRDFNQDGAMDIFAFSDVLGLDGIVVFRGFWENNQLKFEKMLFPNLPQDLLYYSISSPESIAPTEQDFPAIDDLDEDGDLDILAFSATQGFVEFYQNQSIEMGFGLDSLLFLKTNLCWGDFLQDPYSEMIILSETPGDCAYGSPNLDAVHSSAASLITLNLDGDTDKDLLFTDFVLSQIFEFLNTGISTESAHISSMEEAIPDTVFPISQLFIPNPFLVDVNNDGKRDLLIGNFRLGGESQKVDWFFENIGIEDEPVFELKNHQFLTNEILDLGTGAKPVFVDVNADNLMDLVVSNYQKWDSTFERKSTLFLFENIGMTTEPIFELIDKDWLNFGQDSIIRTNLSPNFGDLDGDGDFDLLVGETSGSLSYFENIAGAGNPMEFAVKELDFMAIDVDFSLGAESSPQLIDLNRDGLLDLVVGEREGNLNYFENQGTSEFPFFNPDPTAFPNTDFLGEIDLKIPGFSNGYTVPYFIDYDDSFRLILGSEVDGILEFADIEDNLDGAFAVIINDFSTTHRIGNFQNPALADLNDNGFLELAVGNFRGGLQFFSTNLPKPGIVATKEVFDKAELNVFPNPFDDNLVVLANKEGQLEKVELINLRGKVLKNTVFINEKALFETNGIPSGVYLLRGIGNEVIVLKKVIKH